jgi:hypothetical protein
MCLRCLRNAEGVPSAAATSSPTARNASADPATRSTCAIGAPNNATTATPPASCPPNSPEYWGECG